MKEEKTINKSDCPHIKEIKVTNSNKTKCENCDLTEDLRLCTSCGSVNCCETSNAHDTEHFKETNHPIIKPTQTNYDFTWCYECDAYLK